jgi:hypothetical protein
VVTEVAPADGQQGDVAGSGDGRADGQQDKATGSAAMAEVAAPDEAEAPHKSEKCPPPNLWCECGELVLYLMTGVFVNLKLYI